MLHESFVGHGEHKYRPQIWATFFKVKDLDTGLISIQPGQYCEIQ